jgi:hypothetical protein
LVSTSHPAEQGPSRFTIAGALLLLVTAMAAGYYFIGLPPVIIVGGSGLVGFVLWLKTYRHGAIPPEVILAPFLLTVCGLECHMIEEYLSGFGPAMSRLFDISWTEEGFLVTFTFVGPILYTLTALGLFYRVPAAGFAAWFIFIGPGMAEASHFVFPLLAPAIQPHQALAVSAAVGHRQLFMTGLPNFYFLTTGRYYFPGLYTAILPMIPGIWGIRRTLRAARDRAARR